MRFLKKISKNLIILDEDTSKIVKILNLLSVFLLLGFIFNFAFRKINYNFDWDVIWRFRRSISKGFWMTLQLSFFSLILSLIIGVLTALSSLSKILPLRFISKIYVEFIRGTPLLVQILVFYYIVANSINLDNRFVAGVVVMSLFSGAYIAEIIRAGIKSIAESQLETAKSLGLTEYQTYVYVIFPQVITRTLPPLAGQFASLIKDSSLLSIISVHEFTMVAKEINSSTFSTMEAYLPLTVGYLILTLPVSRFTKYLERKFAYAS
ncbi:MAG: amino acid ABC transporter permease [Candidatus Cloacimonadota bacterium]|nr:MAG: amino acid ABC transporter permease [Candidatus Cloacimonadota bacterium]